MALASGPVQGKQWRVGQDGREYGVQAAQRKDVSVLTGQEAQEEHWPSAQVEAQCTSAYTPVESHKSRC